MSSVRTAEGLSRSGSPCEIAARVTYSRENALAAVAEFTSPTTRQEDGTAS